MQEGGIPLAFIKRDLIPRTPLQLSTLELHEKGQENCMNQTRDQGMHQEKNQLCMNLGMNHKLMEDCMNQERNQGKREICMNAKVQNFSDISNPMKQHLLDTIDHIAIPLVVRPDDAIELRRASERTCKCVLM